MTSEINIESLKKYYGEKLVTYGTTPRGADWNSQESQYTRFEQLIKVCDTSSEFSILDYGCAYGALADFLYTKGYRFQYNGYDFLEEMVLQARQRFKDRPECTFTSQEKNLHPADYAVESGIFNIRLEFSEKSWKEHIIQTLDRMNALSRKGFAVNFLTSYSDAEYMRPHLYYADPCYYFDYCIAHFSKNIALLHDYNMYDFTILVRK